MQRLDLNLLLTLDVLLAEQSVSRAAERLNLTPPAVSHALGRLRAALDDPLLVRAGQRLVPTPRAVALREEVGALIERARAIFQDRRLTDLGAERRTITIRADDGIVSAYGATLARDVHAEAPGLRLRFMGRLDEGPEPLRDGTVDIDIGLRTDMGSDIRCEPLCTDRLVGAVRADHPFGSGPVSIDAYAAASHVVASRRGRPLGPIDRRLAEAGLQREVPIIVPDSITALAVAAGTDHVATVPAGIAAWGQLTMRLSLFPLPFAVPAIDMVLSWHPRLTLDPVHRWLRGRMCQTVRTMLDGIDRSGSGLPRPADDTLA